MAENLNLVHSICAGWARGDYSSAAWAHPEIDYELVGGPAPARWSGVVRMAGGWRDFLSAWDEGMRRVPCVGS